MFSRDASTGDLTFAFEYANGTNGITQLADPYMFAFLSNGKELYVAGGNDDAALVFSVDTSTGTLTLTEEHAEGDTGLEVGALQNVYGVTTDPDGSTFILVFNLGMGSQLLV